MTPYIFRCWGSIATIAVLFFINGFVLAINMLIWIILPECYPTVIRATATGFINFWGKMGGVAGTILIYALFHVTPLLAVSVIVGASLLGMGASFWFNIETQYSVIEDVIVEDSECDDELH